MRPFEFTFARLGIGVALATGFEIWRRHRREAAEKSDLDEFEQMIARLTDEHLAALWADLQTLTAFGAGLRFSRKRDACRREMDSRAKKPE
jgi:hypothetical protein